VLGYQTAGQATRRHQTQQVGTTEVEPLGSEPIEIDRIEGATVKAHIGCGQLVGVDIGEDAIDEGNPVQLGHPQVGERERAAGEHGVDDAGTGQVCSGELAAHEPSFTNRSQSDLAEVSVGDGTPSDLQLELGGEANAADRTVGDRELGKTGEIIDAICAEPPGLHLSPTIVHDDRRFGCLVSAVHRPRASCVRLDDIDPWHNGSVGRSRQRRRRAMHETHVAVLGLWPEASLRDGRKILEPRSGLRGVWGVTLAGATGAVIDDRDPTMTVSEDAPSRVVGPGDFDDFYEANLDPLYRALSLALGNPDVAHEAVDEAMARALQRWDTVGEYRSPAGWVYRVALNWARSRFKARRREVLTDRWQAASIEHSSHPDLHRALAELPTNARSVVVLRYFLGWSTDEVSEALNIAPGTVKSRLSRALSALETTLRETRDER